MCSRYRHLISMPNICSLCKISVCHVNQAHRERLGSCGLDSLGPPRYDAPMPLLPVLDARILSSSLGLKHALSAYCALVLATTMVACSGGGGRETDPSTATDQEKRARIESMYDSFQLSLPADAEVSPSELSALQEEEATVLVDVRNDDERDVSIIPGAISKEEYEAKEDSFQSRPVVAYCTIGYRSGRYVETLRERGVDAKNLRGSLLAWTHAGLPMVNGRGEQVKRAHVYGADWDLLPEGFEAVW